MVLLLLSIASGSMIAGTSWYGDNCVRGCCWQLLLVIRRPVHSVAWNIKDTDNYWHHTQTCGTFVIDDVHDHVIEKYIRIGYKQQCCSLVYCIHCHWQQIPWQQSPWQHCHWWHFPWQQSHGKKLPHVWKWNLTVDTNWNIEYTCMVRRYVQCYWPIPLCTNWHRSHNTGTTLELSSDKIYVKWKFKMQINLMFTKKISRSTVHISYMCTLAGRGLTRISLAMWLLPPPGNPLRIITIWAEEEGINTTAWSSISPNRGSKPLYELVNRCISILARLIPKGILFGASNVPFRYASNQPTFSSHLKY